MGANIRSLILVDTTVAVEDYTEEKTIQFHRGPRTGWWADRARV